MVLADGNTGVAVEDVGMTRETWRYMGLGMVIGRVLVSECATWIWWRRHGAALSIDAADLAWLTLGAMLWWGPR